MDARGRFAGPDRGPPPAEGARHPDGYDSALATLIARVGPTWRVAVRAAGKIRWVGAEPADVKLPRQGWKLHVSAGAHEGVRLLGVIQALVALRVAFKTVGSAEGIVRLNGGEAGTTQIGKVLTAYPRDADDLVRIVSALSGLELPRTGPEILGEYRLAAMPCGALRYGAFGGEPPALDSRGQYQDAIVLDGDSTVPDVRGERPAWMPEPPLAGEWTSQPPMGVLEVGSHKVAPLLLIHSTARGRVFLGVRSPDAASVIIKTARPGVAGDMAGFDSVAKLRREHAAMADLAGKGLCARPLYFLEDARQAYLVMEDLGGLPFVVLSREQQREALPAILDAVERLHAAEYAHRDIKAENIILRDDVALFTDLELAARQGERDVPGGGTWGHVPPEGSLGPADRASDIYAFGALMAGVEAQVSPAALPRGGGRLVGLLDLLGRPGLGALVARATARSAADRSLPKASDLAAALSTARVSSVPRDGRAWAMSAAIACADGVAAQAEKQVRGLAWRTNHYAAGRLCHGINLGCAGVLIGLAVIGAHVGRAGRFASEIGGAAEWLCGEHLDQAPGLFTGEAGVALGLAVAARRLDLAGLSDEALKRLRVATGVSVEHELFFGSAGIVLAAVLMAEVLEDPAPLEIARPLCADLQAARIIQDGVACWPFVEPFEGRTSPFLGVAHGAAGTAVALYAWGQAAGNASAVACGLETLLSIHNVRRGTGASAHFERRVGEGQFGATADWCHGVAGYLWALLYCGGTTEPALRPAVDWAASAVRETNPVSTTTYCHGLAGRLELMMMLSQDPVHGDWASNEADTTAAALRLLTQRRDGRVGWSAEDPQVFTPDLWVGTLGPACALSLYARGVCAPLFSGTVLSAGGG